jgi:CRISPR-associated endonuclease/helicase Cas3
MAIWVIARAQAGREGRLPRRLVYVVDRRVVVDQASAEAMRIAETLAPDGDPVMRDMRTRLGLSSEQGLAISTLRGGKADDHTWSYDPAAPASLSAPST